MMNRSWTYWLKTTYRRQRLVSIAVTAGTVDVLLGGLDGSTSLAAFGLAVAAGAIAWRWWQGQRRRPPMPESPSIYALPDKTSRPSLPLLGISERRHPPRL